MKVKALLLIIIGLISVTLYSQDVNLAIYGNSSSFNPLRNSRFTHLFTPYLFTSLVQIDPITKSYKPFLSNALPEIEYKGKKTYLTYYIRNDAVWDNGSPVTSNDIVFSFMLAKLLTAKEKNSFAWDISRIITYPKNDKQITIVIYGYNEDLIKYVNTLSILQEELFDTGKVLRSLKFSKITTNTQVLGCSNNSIDSIFSKRNKQFVDLGNGPYKIDRWIDDSLVTLTQKTGWWGNKHENEAVFFMSYPEHINYKVGGNDSDALEMLKRGEIDIFYYYYEQWDSVILSKMFNCFSSATPVFDFIAINTKLLKLSSVNTRRALALLVPYDSLSMHLGGTRMKLPVFSEKNKALTEDFPLLQYDVQTAIALLEKDGWFDNDKDEIREKEINGVTEPLKIEFIVYADAGISPMWNCIVTAFKTAGVQLVLKGVKTADTFKNIAKSDYEMAYSGWLYPALPNNLYYMFSTNARYSYLTQYSGFFNSDLNTLITKIDGERDNQKKDEMTRKLFRIIYDYQPAIWLNYGQQQIVVNKKFTNVIINDKGRIYMNALK